MAAIIECGSLSLKGYGTPGSAGCDLMIPDCITLNPGNTYRYNIDLEPGYILAPRSGFAYKAGLHVVNSWYYKDQSYVDIKMFDEDILSLSISKPSAICQAIYTDKVNIKPWVDRDVRTSLTIRGCTGFGSTDMSESQSKEVEASYLEEPCYFLTSHNKFIPWVVTASEIEFITNEKVYLKQGVNVIFTNLYTGLPKNTYARLNAVDLEKHTAFAGLIDCDYRGEVRAILYSNTKMIVEEGTPLFNLTLHGYMQC